jgi:hypothetical protein
MSSKTSEIRCAGSLAQFAERDSQLAEEPRQACDALEANATAAGPVRLAGG